MFELQNIGFYADKKKEMKKAMKIAEEHLILKLTTIVNSNEQRLQTSNAGLT